MSYHWRSYVDNTCGLIVDSITKWQFPCHQIVEDWWCLLLVDDIESSSRRNAHQGQIVVNSLLFNVVRNEGEEPAGLSIPTAALASSTGSACH